MHLWEELPSARSSEVQAIFQYAERCRLADDLAQASARQAARIFAFRPAPGTDSPAQELEAESNRPASDRLALIASDMAAGMRLIYTSAPFRLRHLAARSRENAGLLPRHAKAQYARPAFKTVAARFRLLLRQARSDTAELGDALEAAGESFDAPDAGIAASTGMWRAGVAAAVLLQSGREASWDASWSDLDSRRRDDTLAAFALARSVVRPSDWSGRSPVRLDSLFVFSGAIEQHFTSALQTVVADMRRAGLEDTAVRVLLERRRVPPWLLSQVFRDSPSPWRKY